jgi:hypothetical protein
MVEKSTENVENSDNVEKSSETSVESEVPKNPKVCSTYLTFVSLAK